MLEQTLLTLAVGSRAVAGAFHLEEPALKHHLVCRLGPGLSGLHGRLDRCQALPGRTSVLTGLALTCWLGLLNRCTAKLVKDSRPGMQKVHKRQ